MIDALTWRWSFPFRLWDPSRSTLLILINSPTHTYTILCIPHQLTILSFLYHIFAWWAVDTRTYTLISHPPHTHQLMCNTILLLRHPLVRLGVFTVSLSPSPPHHDIGYIFPPSRKILILYPILCSITPFQRLWSRRYHPSRTIFMSIYHHPLLSHSNESHLNSRYNPIKFYPILPPPQPPSKPELQFNHNSTPPQRPNSTTISANRLASTLLHLCTHYTCPSAISTYHYPSHNVYPIPLP